MKTLALIILTLTLLVAGCSTPKTSHTPQNMNFYAEGCGGGA